MRKAFLVGIDHYEFDDANLSGCINDANTMNVLLETHGDGSPNFSTKMLTSAKHKVTRALVKEGIEKVFADDSDMALFYFSGHGFVKSTGGYLVTSESSKYDEGVSMDELLKIANQSKAKNKIIILDCCHSGKMGSATIENASNVSQLSEGLSILTASRDYQAAIEDLSTKSGVFTTLIADALRGGAADLRGNITPGLLYAYVDEALGAWDQRPIFKTNVTSFAAIRKITPKIPPETMRKLTEYFETPDTEHKLDPSYEDTHQSADPVKTAIFKHLQKFQSVGLVVPVDEEFMYFAAINSKACKLTALGYQYWRLVKEKKV